MCHSGAFFPPAGLPPIALLGFGTLLCLAVLGSLLWLATRWLSQHQTAGLPYAFPSQEHARPEERGYRSSEPKQEYQQPNILPPLELPPQW